MEVILKARPDTACERIELFNENGTPIAILYIDDIFPNIHDADFGLLDALRIGGKVTMTTDIHIQESE